MDIKLETLHLKKSVRCQLFVFILTYCTDIYFFRILDICNSLLLLRTALNILCMTQIVLPICFPDHCNLCFCPFKISKFHSKHQDEEGLQLHLTKQRRIDQKSPCLQMSKCYLISKPQIHLFVKHSSENLLWLLIEQDNSFSRFTMNTT